MKSCLPFLLGLFLFLSFLPGNAYTATEEDYARCYVADLENQTITFVFNPQYWTIYAAPPIYVKGTFNNWANSPYFNMQRDEQGNFSATIPLSKLRQPGFSGRTEFNIIVGATTLLPSAFRRDASSIDFPSDYIFSDGNNHFMLILTPEDFEKAKEDNLKMKTLKTLADFDLTTREGREEISNFRKVPGTKNLFRSFHPIKYSFPQYDTEHPRHLILHELCVEERIKSDINLSGPSSLVPETVTLHDGTSYTEIIPDFYKEILQSGRLLNVTNAYNQTPTSQNVYYQHWTNGLPPTTDIAQSNLHVRTMLKQIVEFINSEDSKAPYLIHCHVGQDRTGVMCALLSALCGATWDEIADDYQKTQRLGNRDFKGLGLLKYAMECFLDIDPYATPAETAPLAAAAVDSNSSDNHADNNSDSSDNDSSENSDSSDNENSNNSDSSDNENSENSDSSDNENSDNSDSSDNEGPSLPLGIEAVDNIGAAVRQVMVDNGYLTDADFDSMITKLNTPVISGIEDIAIEPASEASAPVRYFDLSGRPVTSPSQPGLYIRVEGSSVSKIIL